MDDLVFAKVRGYPAWPARVTGTAWGKYTVFFYGTYEVGSMKPEEMWHYNQKNLERFGPPNMRKKGYSEGLYEIENTPEIVTLPPVVVEEGVGGGEVEHVQIDGFQHDEVLSSDLFLVKISSTNEMKEISVDEDQNNNKLDEFSKAKIECNIEAAEKILLNANEESYGELKKELNEKVQVAKKEAEGSIIMTKVEKLKWLKCEQNLVNLVCEIQKSMSKNTDPTKCLENLKLLEDLDIKPLMVIKIPEVFMTVKKLSTETISNNSDIGLKEIKEISERIKLKIMRKVCKGVEISWEEFEEVFTRKVVDFKDKTVGLTDRERMCTFYLKDL